MATREKDSYSIQSVENALNVLEALCEEGEEVRISRLSEKLGMNKTSVFRLLATFENRGYVEREKGTGRYRLGLSAYEMGQKFLSRMALLRKARPEMERMVRRFNEAVYVAVRRGWEVLFLDMVDTSQQVKIIPLVGNRFPLGTNAAGKVLLAFSSGEETPAESAAPLPSPEELLYIRQQGYALTWGGLGEGVTSIAVPLFTAVDEVPGALCLVGPDFRLPSEKMEQELLPALREVGETVSSKLGHLGQYLGSNSL